VSHLKFDDEQKRIYLEALAEHGMKGAAAKTAGVSNQSVIDHMDNDPEFEEARVKAVETYQAKVITHHQTLLFEGELHEQFDRDGNITSSKRVYPIRLIELELKKVDPNYRDKQQIDVTSTTGGVLVAPAELTPEQWIKQQHEKNEVKAAPGEGDNVIDITPDDAEE